MELCGSPCLHPGACVCQRYLLVGLNSLCLAVSQHRVVACLPCLHSLGELKGHEQRITCRTLPVAAEAL